MKPFLVMAVFLSFAALLGVMGCPAAGESGKSNPDKAKPVMY